MDYNTGESAILTVLTLFILFFAIAFFLIYVLKPFAEERRYIISEIRRAYSKNERRHWQRELKRLYISKIPFIGKKLVKLLDN